MVNIAEISKTRDAITTILVLLKAAFNPFLYSLSSGFSTKLSLSLTPFLNIKVANAGTTNNATAIAETTAKIILIAIG